MSLFQVTQVTAASVPNPPAGTYTLFLDSADGLWKKKDSAGTITIVGMGASLYLSNGTLSEARTVDMGSSSLGFTNAAAGIAIGTATANSSAILDLTSTTEGLLPPRMTTAQKNAISTPATGLTIYDTNLNKLCVYTGGAWETITSV
tara:strand:+ start:2251 stop:2691 length:441 start_codon:yes stop_codon:yes gene_type:complete